MISDLHKDLRYGLRISIREPLYFLSVALTLGVAIGGTTAVFTFFNGVLQRPLAYPDPGRLVKVCERHPELSREWCLAAPGNLRDWERSSRTLAALGLARDWPFSLKRETGSLAVRGGFATPGTFAVLGVEPIMGRRFEDADVATGAPPTALISHAFWVRELGADPDLLGRMLQTDQQAAEVVGLLPEDFEVPGLEEVEIWFSFPPEWLERRDWRGFRTFGRLGPEATLAQARAELQTIAGESAQRFPETNEGYDAEVVSLHAWMVGSIRQPLWVFMSAVGLVLLIAIANVANLVLVRVSRRKREFAIRTVMGASRVRLTCQLSAENGVLALAGAAVGIPMAWLLVRMVRVLAPTDLPRFEDAQLDSSVLLFLLLVALLVCVLLALVASRSGSAKLRDALTEGRQGSSGRSGIQLRNLLVVAEVGLAVLLLVGAALLTRTLFNLLEWRPGFEVEHVMAAFMTGPVDQYAAGEQISGLFRQSIEEAASVPGVVSVGAASAGPLFGGGDGQIRFLIQGRPPPASSLDYPRANWFDVFPSYFSTIGIALRQGRFFNTADVDGSTKVAIVNETLARRYWPGDSPIGQRLEMIELKDEPVALEVVGVVADVSPFRPDRSPEPEIYWPLPQFPRYGTMLVVRTSVDPLTVAKPIETRLGQLEPDLQLGTFRTLSNLAGRQLVRPRFFLFLMGVFAAMGLILATLGLYGLMTSMAAERTFEIAVRMALGADRGDILRLVMGRGMFLGTLGVAAGLGGALLLAPLLASVLVAVDAADGLSFGAAALLLIATCLLGCYLPARRASQLDPAAAMRLAPFA